MTADVRKTSAIVDAMAEEWRLIDALMGGTAAMRKAGKAYLPQWPSEDIVSYQMRLATATLFPAYARTVSVLCGKPFSKPITVGEDVPAQLSGWLEAVDIENRNLDSFAADVFHEALGWGFCGILVDYPPSRGARTVADEKNLGLRPYFVHIRHGNILGWIAEQVNGAFRLKQLRLLETVEVPDGEFATKTIEQVRVLTPGAWRTFRKQALPTSGTDDWLEHESGTTSLQEIPFIPVYGKRRDYMVGTPPMLELGYANVEHWQSKSDQQTILHVARVPILFTKDLGTTEISVGSGALIRADSPTADAKYVEHSGKAIEAGRVSLLDLEDRMRQAGAELLVIKPGNTTEVQTVADNEQGMCDLQRIVQTLEDALDQAITLMAKWIGATPSGHIMIYRDFGAATLAEASANLLYEMRSTGDLSESTLLSELKRRGILSPDIDIEAEILRAKADAPPVTIQETVRP